MVEGVSDCDAFYYPLNGNDIVPKREYVFGDVSGERNLVAYRISDYNKATNILVAMKLTRKLGNKTVSLVWLQP